MSIVARRGRVAVEPRSRLLRFERPSNGVDAAGTVGSPNEPAVVAHELARLALDLVLRTSEPLRLPARWTTPVRPRGRSDPGPARADPDADRARGLVLAGGLGRGDPDGAADADRSARSGPRRLRDPLARAG